MQLGAPDNLNEEVKASNKINYTLQTKELCHFLCQQSLSTNSLGIVSYGQSRQKKIKYSYAFIDLNKMYDKALKKYVVGFGEQKIF